jgi:hypothetical protein
VKRRLLTLPGILVLVSSAAQAQPLPPPPPPPPDVPASANPAPTLPPLPPAVPTYPSQPQPPAPAYAAPYPAYNAITVDLSGTVPSMGYEIYEAHSRPGKDAPLATCPGPCRLILPPGEYHFRVTETADTLAGSRKLEINASSSIHFDPDTKAKRTTGLVLGIGGPILAILGFGTLLGASCMDCTGSDRRNDGAVAAGAAMLLGGLALTPIGWVMYGTSYKPEYEIKRLGPRVGRGESPWRFGISPTLGGAAIGGQLAF